MIWLARFASFVKKDKRKSNYAFLLISFSVLNVLFPLKSSHLGESPREILNKRQYQLKREIDCYLYKTGLTKF